MEKKLSKIDRDALTRALALARESRDPEVRRQIERKIKSDPWREVAEFAAFGLQCDNLKLKPWDAPPCHTHVDEPFGDSYGARPQEVALRRLLLDNGLSLFEPDPIRALAALEDDRVSEKPGPGRGATP